VYIHVHPWLIIRCCGLGVFKTKDIFFYLCVFFFSLRPLRLCGNHIGGCGSRKILDLINKISYHIEKEGLWS